MGGSFERSLALLIRLRQSDAFQHGWQELWQLVDGVKGRGLSGCHMLDPPREAARIRATGTKLDQERICRAQSVCHGPRVAVVFKGVMTK